MSKIENDEVQYFGTDEAGNPIIRRYHLADLSGINDWNKDYILYAPLAPMNSFDQNSFHYQYNHNWGDWTWDERDSNRSTERSTW
jgi:hypothetical protein